MGVPIFDSQKHHIGLGPIKAEDSSTGVAELYGFLLNGGYLRRGQNWQSPTDFGGARDLIAAPSLSRWTQDDFSGGVGQLIWGDDPAMLARTFNMIPVTGRRTIRTAPPLIPWRSENVGGRLPQGTFAYGNYLYVVHHDRVRALLISDQSRFDYPSGASLGENYLTAWCFDREEATLYLGSDNGQAAGTRYLLERRSIPSLGAPPQPGLNFPTDIDSTAPEAKITGMHFSHGVLLVCFRNQLWTLKPPKLNKDIVAADWAKIGKLPGPFRGAVSYNGLTYILCAGSSVRRASVVAFDGTTLLPVTEFPYSFEAYCIESYAGRVYVGGAGLDIGDADKYAELYEITGSSLRLLKSFGPDARMNGVMKPKAFRDLHVHEGMLWMFERGVGLIAYDVTTDAFYGGPTFQEFDSQREAYGFASTGEVLYSYVVHPLDQNADGWRRPATPADPLAFGYNGTVITSAFGPEPARRKRWSEIVVLARYASCGVEWRTDAASSDTGWRGDLPTSIRQDGDYYWTTVDLRSLPPSEQVSFKITMHRGVDVVNWSELVAFTAGFVFLDTGKWSWSFTVNGTERVEGPDGNGVFQDVHDIGSELRRYWRERIPLQFRDLSGDTHEVQILDFQESQPIIATPVGFTDPETLETTQAQEAFYTVTLIEV